MISGFIPDRRTLRQYARYASIFAWACVILAAVLDRVHRVARETADERVKAHNARRPHGPVDPPDPEDILADDRDEDDLDDHPLDADT